jgi:transcriptional regulator with XRE-family HTH domain
MKTKTRKSGSGPDHRTVGHQLRQAITEDGRTAFALGRDAEVDPGMIQRFLNGERGLTLATVDKLALALGLRLTIVGRLPGRGRPRKVAKALAPVLEDDEQVETPDNPSDPYSPSTNPGNPSRIGEN